MLNNWTNTQNWTFKKNTIIKLSDLAQSITIASLLSISANTSSYLILIFAPHHLYYYSFCISLLRIYVCLHWYTPTSTCKGVSGLFWPDSHKRVDGFVWPPIRMTIHHKTLSRMNKIDVQAALLTIIQSMWSNCKQSVNMVSPQFCSIHATQVTLHGLVYTYYRASYSCKHERALCMSHT